MNMKKALAILAAAGSLAALAASSGRAGPSYESKRLDRAIAIDGEAPEWAGSEAHYDESDGYKLGFFNDDEYLYVYFATWNLSTQRRILMNGFTVWFDGSGKKNKTLGLNYPQPRVRGRRGESAETRGGSPDEEAPEIRREVRGDRPDGVRRPEASPDPAKLAAALNEARFEALLKSPAGDSLLLLSSGDSSGSGIRAMLRARSRLLVIELRVPLDEGGASPYAINLKPGKAVSVGFETGKMELPRMTRPEGMPESDRTGAGMRPGGGMAPGSGGPGGMGGPAAPSELKFWTKVKLAR
jgi:hypothetical protein